MTDTKSPACAGSGAGGETVVSSVVCVSAVSVSIGGVVSASAARVGCYVGIGASVATSVGAGGSSAIAGRSLPVATSGIASAKVVQQGRNAMTAASQKAWIRLLLYMLLLLVIP